MVRLTIPLLLVGSFVALMTTEASAVVYCAAGVYRRAAWRVLSSSPHDPLSSRRVLLWSPAPGRCRSRPAQGVLITQQ